MDNWKYWICPSNPIYFHFVNFPCWDLRLGFLIQIQIHTPPPETQTRKSKRKSYHNKKWCIDYTTQLILKTKTKDSAPHRQYSTTVLGKLEIYGIYVPMYNLNTTEYEAQHERKKEWARAWTGQRKTKISRMQPTT
jgi:hypothetical protein